MQVAIGTQRRHSTGDVAMSLVNVPALQLDNDRFLVGKVLIKRRDVHAGTLGDPVGRETLPAVLDENVSSCFQNGVHRGSSSCLAWLLSRDVPGFWHKREYKLAKQVLAYIIFRMNKPLENSQLNLADLGSVTWETFRVINASRRAVRHFDGMPISDEVVLAVLAEAQLAPSSKNLQPYCFHWIKDARVHEAIAATCRNQRAAKSASTLIVVSANSAYGLRTLNGWEAHVEQTDTLDDKSKAYHRQELNLCRRFDRISRLWLWEPLMVLISWLYPMLDLLPVGPSRTRHWVVRNSLYAAQTLLLAAAASGLDSCPMEGFSARQVARLLKLPRGSAVPLVIALGRRMPNARIEPRWRVPLEQVVVVH